MKVARLYSFNDIRVEDEPVPEPSEEEALVRVRVSGICSGDAMPWYIEKKAPLVLGHEPSGEIVKLGNRVKGFKVGDRVFVHHHAPCRSCNSCLRGDYVQCPTWKLPGIRPGGIAEYIVVSSNSLREDTLRLPDNLSFEDGVMVEPLGCVVKSFKRSGIKEGDTLVVIGLGVMGMLHIMVGRHFGARRIIGADRVGFRLKRALELGADDVIDVSKAELRAAVMELTEGRGAEVVIVGPNSVEAMKEGLDVVAPGGSVVFFTPARPGETLLIDPNSLYFRDINIVTSYSCGPDDTRMALGLLEKGLVRAKDLITHRFSIEETERAYRIVSKAEESLKVVIDLSSS
ncbi:MAG: sorbitol dehydrogenase [Nitrospirae bacterium]|nr:MAG: sorbitol dehydrogenase [Nitrospirota bacterium]